MTSPDRAHAPFIADADYWDAVAAHLRVRLHRMAVEHHPDRAKRRRCCIPHLRAEETHLRETVKRRLDATRRSEFGLSIDKVQAALDLADHERCVLVVSMAATLMTDSDELLGSVVGRPRADLSVSLVLDILGLDLEQRARCVNFFRPDGRLVKAGLLAPGWLLDTPSDLLGSGVAVTYDCMECLLGRRKVSDVRLPEPD